MPLDRRQETLPLLAGPLQIAIVSPRPRTGELFAAVGHIESNNTRRACKAPGIGKRSSVIRERSDCHRQDTHGSPHGRPSVHRTWAATRNKKPLFGVHTWVQSALDIVANVRPQCSCGGSLWARLVPRQPLDIIRVICRHYEV